MLRDQSETPQDARVLEQLDLAAFDYESLRRYRIRLQNMRPDYLWENLQPVEFLQKLGCIGRSDDGSLHPTAAGLLMFGFENEIVKEYPFYFLDYQEHDDEDTRWTNRIVSTLGEWSGNLFDFYFRICYRLTENVKRPFKLEGMTRIDDTPIHKAIREALANSLIHANYYDRLGLVIHRRPQSITMANPGGLRVSLDEALAGGVSDVRNVTLVKLFNFLNIGERAGSGLPNIYAAWKMEGWPPPCLEEKFNPERTVLSLVIADETKFTAWLRSGKTAGKTSGKQAG
jgi:predicted HTH transcriptional regulator